MNRLRLNHQAANTTLPQTRRPNIKTSAKQVLGCILWSIMLVGLAIYAWNQRETLLEARALSLWRISLAIGATVLGWILSSKLVGELLMCLGRNLSLTKLTISTAAAVASNNLPLRPGTVVRALYIRAECGLSLIEYGATLMAQFLIGAMTSALLLSAVLLCTSGIWTQFQTQLLVMVVLAALPLTWLAFRIRQPEWLALLVAKHHHAQRLSSAISLMVQHPQRIVRGLTWSVLATLCFSLRLWTVLHALHVQAPVLASIFITAAGTFAMLIAVTPGGLGIREGIMAIAGAAFGIPLEIALLAATVDRALVVLATLVVGCPCAVWISYRLSRLRSLGATAS